MSRLTDAELEQIARIVKQVVDSDRPKESEPKYKVWTKYLFENWHIPTFAFIVLVFVGAMAFEGASPLYYFKRVSLDDRDVQAKLNAHQYREALTARHIELGYMLLDQGLERDALKEFEAAKELSENNVDVENAIRIAKLFQEDAAGQYNPSVFVTRVNALFGEEMPAPRATSSSELRQASEPPPAGAREVDNPHVLAVLGNYYRLSGDTGKAVALYEQALSARPSLAEAAAGLGHIAYDAGEFPDAIVSYERARSIYPDNVQYISALASAHRLNGAPEAAFALFEQARTADPDTLIHHVEMSIVLRSQDRFDDSYNLLGGLLRQLDDEATYARLLQAGSTNDDPWLIAHAEGSESLTTSSEKMAYICAAATLSAYLAGVQDGSNLGAYRATARAEAKAMRLINLEILELKRGNPDRLAGLERFAESMADGG